MIFLFISGSSLTFGQACCCSCLVQILLRWATSFSQKLSSPVHKEKQSSLLLSELLLLYFQECKQHMSHYQYHLREGEQKNSLSHKEISGTLPNTFFNKCFHTCWGNVMSDYWFRRTLGRCAPTSQREMIYTWIHSLPTIKLGSKVLWQQVQKGALLAQALLHTQYSECHPQPRYMKEKDKIECEPGWKVSKECKDGVLKRLLDFKPLAQPCKTQRHTKYILVLHETIQSLETVLVQKY